MTEQILPGVAIEVRPEGLIVPLGVTVGNIGIVGTASKGPVGEPVILGSYAEAKGRFGDYDPWDPNSVSSALTLVRALEQAYRHGATTVFAVRVAEPATVAAAGITLQSATGDCVILSAKSDGTWGNGLSVNVSTADEDAFVENEDVDHTAVTISLTHSPVIKSARNRISLKVGGGTIEQPLQILYDDVADAPVAGQVKITLANGNLEFGEAPAPGDEVVAFYRVAQSAAIKVTLRYEDAEEAYTVVSGDDLVRDLASPVTPSAWVVGTAATNSAEIPDSTTPADAFHQFSGGTNGASGANYQGGLDLLLDQPAHIIVVAGQADDFGDELAGHCQVASSDSNKRERIGVVGSSLNASVADIQGHSLSSDRIIFVAPGIKTNDNAASPPVEVTLPGTYAAAAVAGLLSGFSAHISPTNKSINVGGLEQEYSPAELRQLVQGRVLALENRLGFRIVKGITTSTNTAWHQITTRRIVDFAKFGVRSAANSYIGLLNNERVRGAMRASINSFLAEMVLDEKLVSYELDVSATRDEEIRGIARVTMTLRPTFSIDFIKVTMFLE